MNDEREALLGVAAESAIRGNLLMLDSLMDRDDGLRWLLPVLESTSSWAVRVRATELSLYLASSVELEEAEEVRLLSRLRDLDREAVAAGVVLTESERKRVHDLDPERLPGGSTDVPTHSSAAGSPGLPAK